MSKIIYPKIWAAEEILKASELNNEFAAISAVVNGQLDNENIAGSAGIAGSKIANAPQGIDTAQINNGAVTKDKIGPGAVVFGKIGAEAVDSAAIKDLTIQTGDIKDGQITNRKMAIGGSIWTATQDVRDATLPPIVQYAGIPVNDYLHATFTPRGSFVRVWGAVMGTMLCTSSSNFTVRCQLMMNTAQSTLMEQRANCQGIGPGSGGMAGTVPFTFSWAYYAGCGAGVANTVHVNIFQPPPFWSEVDLLSGYLLVEEPA